MKRWKDRKRVQGAGWRRLDNTGKLFAMVTGEDLSNVFRVSAVLAEEVDGARLQEALKQTLPEFQVFQVKLRRGFFWNYFESNTREPEVELETSYPCRFIEPHSSQMYLFRVSFFKKRINFEVFHGLTDGMGNGWPGERKSRKPGGKRQAGDVSKGGGIQRRRLSVSL